jgi:hypothetical protein
LSTEDIKRVCKTINNNLPSNSDIICLPFYRELPPKWAIFNELSKKVKQITVDRTDLFDEIYPDISNITKKVAAGTYKRAIVVATNIAEASITIDSLKYVIDTGYFISVSDNPYTFETNIDKKKISEASRIQRRGRVGRVGSGTVYYMYMKDSRKDFKSEFKICIENISNDLWDLMPINNNDIPLIPILNWDRLLGRRVPSDFNAEPFSEIFRDNKHLVDCKIFKNLLVEQYTSNGYFNLCVLNFLSIFNNINGNFDYSNKTAFNINKTNSLITKRSPRFVTGYDIKSCIFDQFGDFFIVHPEEKNIKREILTGKILSINKYVGNKNIDLHDGIIVSHRIYLYIKSCFINNLLIDHKSEYIPLTVFQENNVLKFARYDFNYEKSIVGRIISKLIENLKFHDSPVINRSIISTLIYAYICNIDDIVLIMIMLLHYSNYQLSGLNQNFKAYGELYGNDDLFIYYNIAKNIRNKISLIEKNNQEIIPIIFSKEKQQYMDQKKKILNDIKNKENYWILDIQLDHYNKFNILDNQNKLDINKNIFDFLNENAKRLSKNMIKQFIDIISEESISIDSNAANKLLKYYMENKSSLDKLKNINQSKTDINSLLWFKYNMPIKPHIDEYTCVKKSFIHGFGIFQTTMYNPTNNEYVDINFPAKRFKSVNSTLSKISDMSVYLSRNTLKNEISILINSDIDTLTECDLYGYNPTHIQLLTEYNNIDMLNISKKLFNKFTEIVSKKNIYINHLKPNTVNHPQLTEKLYKYKNNFTEYLIKLWTTDINSNIYYVNTNTFDGNNYRYFENNNQAGGDASKSTIKINVNKIPDILNKYNIKFIDFFKSLILLKNNNHHVYQKNGYLYIH